MSLVLGLNSTHDVFLIVIDAAFFSSSLLKIVEGGWFPLALAAIVFTVMTTWHRGRQIAMARQKESGTSFESFLHSLAEHPPLRGPGTAMFMAGNADGVPEFQCRRDFIRSRCIRCTDRAAAFSMFLTAR